MINPVGIVKRVARTVIEYSADLVFALVEPLFDRLAGPVTFGPFDPDWVGFDDDEVA